MEIEKPFKCSVCSTQFTNAGHLEVHKKRHVMSLNLFKPGSLNITNGPDGFVDETPTPTRFISTCEEVGLFQDLQNVNPFDLQFKAASSSPSTEAFEFTFSNSKKGDDTLNTPQVNLGFGYTPSAAPTPTSSVQNSGVSTTTSSSTDLEVVMKTAESEEPTIPSTTEESREIRVESTTPDNETLSPQIFPSEDITTKTKSRHKSQSNLKLNLAPASKNPVNLLSDSISTDSQEDILYCEEDEDEILKSTPSSKKSKKSLKEPQCKKTELLERNRAAASRSRERRKQWVSMLETRCQTLQTTLSQAQNEVAKVRAENTLLREEMGKHLHCDVTRAGSSHKLQSLTSEPPVKHSTSTESSQRNSNTASVIKTPIIPTAKSKRGRPKKGYEKRVEICIPTSSSPKPPVLLPPVRIPPRSEAPIKVEILPMTGVAGQQLPTVYVLKRGS